MSAQEARRSWTGNHNLLPASRPNQSTAVEALPTYSFLTWTLGRGSVIWRIWPAVLLHTLFAALITTLCMRGILHLEIPNIMLTVLGVVIGFVISYRAGSGYERYWLGRGYWSDIVKHSRTISRLIWFHVPLRLSPKTPEEVQSGQTERSVKEMSKVMAEKKMALDLLYGFALAVKHHLRGEIGIYYEDMYHLIRPLHDHEHTADDDRDHATSSATHLRPGHRITTKVNATQSGIPTTVVPPTSSAPPLQDYHYLPTPSEQPRPDFVIPPINAYGTFDPSSQLLQRSGRAAAPASGQQDISRSGSPASHLSSISSVNQPLLPSSMPPAQDAMSKVSRDLIPFASTWAALKHYFGFHGNEAGACEANQDPEPETTRGSRGIKRNWQGPVGGNMHMKSHPKIAGGGENLPLEIIRCLSEWLSVLEDRCTVQGPSIGSLLGGLMSLEDSLTGLERILTTPLPFVYSVHISTVWLYLFFLPFQLVNQFGYYTIAGTAMAAFIYLGFVAAGEEIEQPFGYDDNDLDLDLFCKRIIGSDIEHLKTSPALNVYLGPLQGDPLVVHRRSMTLNEITSAGGVSKLEGDGDHFVVGSPVGVS